MKPNCLYCTNLVPSGYDIYADDRPLIVCKCTKRKTKMHVNQCAKTLCDRYNSRTDDNYNLISILDLEKER